MQKVILDKKYNEFKIKDRIIIKKKKGDNYQIGKVFAIFNIRGKQIFSIKIECLYNKKNNKFLRNKDTDRVLVEKNDICKVKINKGV